MSEFEVDLKTYLALSRFGVTLWPPEGSRMISSECHGGTRKPVMINMIHIEKVI